MGPDLGKGVLLLSMQAPGRQQCTRSVTTMIATRAVLKQDHTLVWQMPTRLATNTAHLGLSAGAHLQLTCLYEVGSLADSHFGLQSYGSHARLNLRPRVLVSCLLQLCLCGPLLAIMAYILPLLVADHAEGRRA